MTNETGTTGVAREMPKYKCHKEVYALKIEKVEYDPKTQKHTLTPADEGYGPFEVNQEYIDKHCPKQLDLKSMAGGYYVVYSPDGYKSYSPGPQFEDGYTRI